MVLKAFRLKCKTAHPDKFADPAEKARKTEEFKVLQTAKEILQDPMLTFYYREWAAQNQEAAATRGREPHRPKPTQARWPPPASTPGAPSSSSRQRPPPDPQARQHFEEARAKFTGRPAEKAPPPRPSAQPRNYAYDPWAEDEEETAPKAEPKPATKAPPKNPTAAPARGYDPRASEDEKQTKPKSSGYNPKAGEDERPHVTPQKRMPSKSPGAPSGGRPHKAAPPPQGAARPHKAAPPPQSHQLGVVATLPEEVLAGLKRKPKLPPLRGHLGKKAIVDHHQPDPWHRPPPRGPDPPRPTAVRQLDALRT
eukprot:Skav207696  [mRNA]  locus=scaffold3057:198379:199308:- [translate_table: standard]